MDTKPQRLRYPTDLSDAQWRKIEHLVPAVRSGTSKGGRPAKYSRREILNAQRHLLYKSEWLLLENAAA